MAGFGRRHVLHESQFFELAGSLTVEVEFIVTEEEAQLLFELRDLVLNLRLLVLGVVVLGVLSDFTKFARVTNPLGNLAASIGLQRFKFLLQALKAGWGENHFFSHQNSLFWSCGQRRRS